MKHLVACLAAWVCLSGNTALASASGYHVTSVGVDEPTPALTRTVLTITSGHEPLNSFEVIRVRRSGPLGESDRPVMLLAPFALPAAFWELSETGDYGEAFAPRMALAGYDVWLVDSRLAAAEPGECESGAVDCSAMKDWDQELAISDAMFVQRLVHVAHPNERPTIGGFSGGSSTAMATVERHPHAFAGLFMWEGTLYSADPDIRARNAAFCSQDESRLASGLFFDSAVQGFKLLFQLAAAAPNDPSPIPVFPPGTTNLQALLFAFTIPDPSNPLNFTADFVRLVGDPFAATLTYSDLERVMLLGPLIGNYAPIAFLRDTHCSLGGVDDRFTDDLDRFSGKVLVFAEGLGFGQMMLDTAALMTRAEVTIDFHAELAESDRYFHAHWQDVALAPLLSWLGTFD